MPQHDPPWSGSGLKNCLLINARKLSKFKRIKASVKAVCAQIGNHGLHINHIVCYFDHGDGTFTFQIFRRDARALPRRSVCCSSVEKLVEIVNEEVNSLDFRQHTSSTQRNMLHLKRSSHPMCFSQVGFNQPVTSMALGGAYEGIWIPCGCFVRFVVGTPYSLSYNDIHIAMVQRGIVIGYGGNGEYVQDLQGTRHIQGDRFSKDCPPAVGESVYPQRALLNELGLPADFCLGVEGVRTDENGDCVVKVDLFDGRTQEVLATDLCKALPQPQNNQNLSMWPQSALADELRGILFTLACWGSGTAPTLRERFSRVPEDRFRLEVTLEVFDSAQRLAAVASFSADHMRDALECCPDADGRHMVFARANFVHGPGGTHITMTPPSGLPAYTPEQVGGKKYDPSGAAGNLEISKNIMKKSGNPHFVEEAIPLLEEFAGSFRASRFPDMEVGCETPTDPSHVPCCAYLVTAGGNKMFPLGVDEEYPALREPVTMSDCVTPKIPGRPVRYPTKEAQDELGNPIPLPNGDFEVESYEGVCQGILEPNLENVVKIFAQKKFCTPEQILDMVRACQVLFSVMSLRHVAAHLAVRLGSLDRLTDEALRLLPQYQMKRGQKIDPSFGDSNRVRQYPTVKMLRQALEEALKVQEVGMEEEEKDPYPVTYVHLTGADFLVECMGDTDQRMQQVRSVLELEPEGGKALGMLAMTQDQLRKFFQIEDGGARGRKTLQKYQNAICEEHGMNDLQFARLVCRIAARNPEYMAWAKEMVFATLPKIKIDSNPNSFINSYFDKPELQKEYMMPVYCLLCGDGQNLEAAMCMFREWCDDYAARKDAEAIAESATSLKSALDEYKAAVAKVEQENVAKPTGGPCLDDEARSTTDQLFSCASCLKGARLVGERLLHWDHRKAYCTPCMYVNCDGRDAYEFERCTHVHPNGKRCELTTCKSYRDSAGCCPLHKNNFDEDSEAKWWASMALPPTKKSSRGMRTIISRYFGSKAANVNIVVTRKVPLGYMFFSDHYGRETVQEDGTGRIVSQRRRDDNPHLPALACTHRLVGNGHLVWIEQFIGGHNTDKFRVFMLLLTGEMDEATGTINIPKKKALEILAPLMQNDGVSRCCYADWTPAGGYESKVHNGECLEYLQVSTGAELPAGKKKCTGPDNRGHNITIKLAGQPSLNTGIKCFPLARGGPSVCRTTAECVGASVAMMNHVNTFVATETDFSHGEVRASLARCITGNPRKKRDCRVLRFSSPIDLKEYKQLQSEFGLKECKDGLQAPPFPCSATHQVKGGVPPEVYTAHETGTGLAGETPTATAERLRKTVLTQSAKVKKLLRDKYSVMAALQKAANSAAAEVSLRATPHHTADGMYVSTPKPAVATHSVWQPLPASVVSIPSVAAETGDTGPAECKGHTCPICLDPDEGIYIKCENEHPEDIVYCRACAEIVRQEGICPICRGDIEG